MKVGEMCAVGFTASRFLMPLGRRLKECGYEVKLLATDDGFISDQERKEFELVHIPISRTFHLKSLINTIRHARKVLREERFDVLHVHTPIGALVGRISAIGSGTKWIVYTVHGFYFHERMAVYQYIPHVALEWLLGWITDRFFFQSGEDYTLFKKLFPWRKADMVHIGNGVSQDRFYRDGGLRRKRREALGIIGEELVYGFAGRIVKEKGIDELLDAFIQNKNRGLKSKLVIAGMAIGSERDDSTMSRVRERAAESDDIILVVNEDEMNSFYNAIDVFVLPSYREGLPRSIIEAKCVGLPVVTTNIRGCRELVRDGVDGYIVEPGDSVGLAKAMSEVSKEEIRNRMTKELDSKRLTGCWSEESVLKKEIQVFAELRERRRDILSGS